MKIFKLSFLLSLVLLVMSCEKDRAFPEYEDLEKGAFPRIIDGVNGILDYEDPAGSGLDWTVEFYDESNGSTVDSYVWTVAYPGFGPAQIASKSRADFTTSADGLPSTTIAFTFQDVFDALGMTIDDIILGEPFTFDGTLTAGSKTFTVNNTGSNVISSGPFSGFFNFNNPVDNLPCIHQLSGTFDAVTKATNQEAGIGWDDCGAAGTEWTGTVRWVADHDESVFGPGTYDVVSLDADVGEELFDQAMGAYYACYGVTANSGMTNGTDGTAGDVRIFIDCNKVSYLGASQWGEVYTATEVSSDGADLTFCWTNDYGEGACTTLTRTDGNAWPDDMRK